MYIYPSYTIFFVTIQRYMKYVILPRSSQNITCSYIQRSLTRFIHEILLDSSQYTTN